MYSLLLENFWGFGVCLKNSPKTFFVLSLPLDFHIPFTCLCASSSVLLGSLPFRFCSPLCLLSFSLPCSFRSPFFPFSFLPFMLKNLSSGISHARLKILKVPVVAFVARNGLISAPSLSFVVRHCHDRQHNKSGERKH